MNSAIGLHVACQAATAKVAGCPFFRRSMVRCVVRAGVNACLVMTDACPAAGGCFWTGPPRHDGTGGYMDHGKGWHGDAGEPPHACADETDAHSPFFEHELESFCTSRPFQLEPRTICRIA